MPELLVDTVSCWRWCGAINTNGYGQLNVNGKTVKAHRYVYERLVGPIPEGMELDHVCRCRNCVNPDHLEPVSRKENVLRGLKGRLVTHCPQGHELSSENLLKKPRRDCKVCHKNRERNRRQRAKNAA